MEAELRALRNELSNRSSSNNPSEAQIMSSTVQKISDDLDNLSDDNPTDSVKFHIDRSQPDPGIDEDTDTSLEEQKLSIDLDKHTSDDRYQDEEGDDEEHVEDEHRNHSFTNNHHENNSTRDIPHTKNSLDRHYPSDHKTFNGRNGGKQRNGRPKGSDSISNSSDKDQSYRESNNERSFSTKYSREHDNDELSNSPMPISSKATKDDYNGTNSKDNNSQKIVSSSKPHNNTPNHKGESSHGSNGRNSDAKMSRELLKNSDERKIVASDQKQPATSSLKSISSSKIGSSHASSGTNGSSLSSNRPHTKIEINRRKDKTE